MQTANVQHFFNETIKFAATFRDDVKLLDEAFRHFTNKHYNLQHNSEMPERFIEQFHIIAKCSGKFDCLVKEMLYIRMRKPTLNVQTDSIRAKVFV